MELDKEPRRFITSSNGKLITVDLIDETKDGVIKEFKLSLKIVILNQDGQESKFKVVEFACCRFAVERHAEVDLVTSKMAQVDFLGMNSFCALIIVRQRSVILNAHGPVSLCMLLFTSGKWRYSIIDLRPFFENSSHDQLKNIQFILADGPFILIHDTEEHQLHLLKPELVDFESAPTSGLITVNQGRTDMNTARNFIGSGVCKVCQILNCQGNLAICVLALSETQLTRCIWDKFICLESPPFEEVINRLPVIPQIYVPIVCTSLLIWNIEGDHDIMSIAFATTEKQLVIYSEQDKSINCFDINMKTCISLTKNEIGPSHNVLILQSLHEGFLIFSLDDKSVLEHYQEASNVLIDDFMGRGHNQVLILFETPDDIENYPYILTDYSCCYINTEAPNKDHVIKDLSQSQGYRSMWQAILARNQSLGNELADLRRRCKDKDLLIKDTWLSMQRMSSGNNEIPTSVFDEDLIPLVESGDTTDEVTKSGSVQVAAQCTSIWQRIVLDKWVVGAEIQNTGNRSLVNLSLCLGLNETLTSSKMHHPLEAPASKEGNDSLKKKPRLGNRKSTEFGPNDKVTLTTVSTLPDLTSSDRCVAFLMLKYQVECPKDKNQLRTEFQYLGEVILTDEDIVSEKNLVSISATERGVIDSRAFDDANATEEFLVACEHTDVNCIPALINNVLQLNEEKVAAGIKRTCSRSGIEVQLEIKGKVCYCYIVARDQNQLTCALRLISRSLPYDTSMYLGRNPSVQEDLINELILNLEKELQFSDENFKTPIVVPDMHAEVESEEVFSDMSAFTRHCKRKRELIENLNMSKEEKDLTSIGDDDYLNALAATNSTVQALFYQTS